MIECVVRLSSGSDYIRVIGIALVLYQHICSLLDVDHLTRVGRLNVGQLGVALFLSLSGYLAGNTSRPPRRWIVARLRRIYPAYWIAISACLAAAAVTGYKPVSLGLAGAEFLGVAWFTHAGGIVNVPTWYVSLLLVCYGIAFVMLLASNPKELALAVGCLATGVTISRGSPLYVTHLSTFVFGFAAASAEVNRSRNIAGLLSLALGAIALLVNMQIGYAAIGLAGLAAGLAIPRIDPLSEWVAAKSYYVYLVHGPIFLAITMAVGKILLAVIVLGVPIAFAMAVLLEKVASIFESRLTEFWRSYGWSRKLSGEMQPLSRPR